MREEMRNEVVELTVSACEKFASNYEVFPEREFLRAQNIMIFLIFNLCRQLLVLSRIIWTRSLASIGMLWSARGLALRSPTKPKTYSIYSLAAIWPLYSGSALERLRTNQPTNQLNKQTYLETKSENNKKEMKFLYYLNSI